MQYQPYPGADLVNPLLSHSSVRIKLSRFCIIFPFVWQDFCEALLDVSALQHGELCGGYWRVMWVSRVTMSQGRQRAPLRAALLLLLILWARSCVPLFAQERTGKIKIIYDWEYMNMERIWFVIFALQIISLFTAAQFWILSYCGIYFKKVLKFNLLVVFAVDMGS